MTAPTWREEPHCTCDNGHIFPEAEMLVAQHPFDPDDQVHGCPQCRTIRNIYRACDRTGCHRAASSGTPDGHSYRWTCHTHHPALGQKGIG